MKKILRMRSLNFITFVSRKPSSIDCVYVQVRSLQLIILFIMIDDVGYRLLMIKTFTIYGIFCQIGLDDIEFTIVSSTFTIFAETTLIVMMIEICIMQFGSCFSKYIFLLLTFQVLMPQIMVTIQFVVKRGVQAVRIGSLIKMRVGCPMSKCFDIRSFLVAIGMVLHVPCSLIKFIYNEK